MFLNDPLGVGWRHVAVPRPFRVDDRDGPLNTDAQTLAFGAIAGSIGPRDVELLHALLDVFPRLIAGFRVTAIGAQTNEQMPLQLANAKLLGHRLGWKSLGIGHGLSF